MTNSFSTKKAIHFAWKTVTSSKNIWFFIGFMLLVILYHIITGALGEESMILYILLTLFSFYVQLVIFNVGIQALDNKPMKFSNILKGVSFKNTTDYFLASILIGLTFIAVLLAGGLITFLTGSSAALLAGVPNVLGIVLLAATFLAIVYFSIKWQFSAYSILDKSSKAIDSLKHSFKITKGMFWQLVWFFILVILINILGVIALGVGVIITGSLTLVATAHVYKQLSK